MDVLNKILAKLESLDGRIGQLEQQFIGKTYTFPNVGNLEKWIQDFGTTAKEARINIQLIVNVVQFCNKILMCAKDARSFPPPVARWGEGFLELNFNTAPWDAVGRFAIEIDPNAYCKARWRYEGDGGAKRGEIEVGSPPDSNGFSSAISALQ